MSMGAGVEAGSMLVPEVACWSSASMRVLGAFIVFVEWECMFMPGMSGIDGCCVCASAKQGVKSASTNTAAGKFLGTADFLLFGLRRRRE
jgi:hypothetical protein